MAYEEMIFEHVFANLVFRLPWQQIKFKGLDKIICFAEDYSRNISLNFCQTFYSKIGIKFPNIIQWKL